MRRRLLISAFLLSVAAVAIGGHVYLAQRLIFDPAFEQPVRGLLLGLLVCLGATWFLQPVVAEVWAPARARMIAWPASLWMGFAWLLITLLAVSDTIWWLVGARTWAAVGLDADAGGAARTRALGVVLLAATGGVAGLLSAFRAPRLRRIEVRLARWPRPLDGFRIVQISDIHIGPILGRGFAEQLVARCNAAEPDLIAITGDLVDGSVRRLADEVAPFAHLRARHGVYFVTGNHDYYSGAERWVAHLSNLGIRVLRNERVAIGDDGGGFDLAGVDDHNGALVGGGPGEDVPAALAGRDPRRAVILLAHDPMTFAAAARHAVDLQISGHTHGGQIWPFAYLIRLVTPYVAGRHAKNGSQIYVSRGTGFWGPCMRLFAPAEITELVLRGADRA